MGGLHEGFTVQNTDADTQSNQPSATFSTKSDKKNVFKKTKLQKTLLMDQAGDFPLTS